MKMMKQIKYIIMALVAAVLTTGCVKEDLDECDNVTIYFQYLADGDKDVLYQYMSKVDLYVLMKTDTYWESAHIIRTN